MTTSTIQPGASMQQVQVGAQDYEDEEDIIIDMVDEDDDEDDNNVNRSHLGNGYIEQASRAGQCMKQVPATGGCDGLARPENAAESQLEPAFSAGDLIWFDPNQLGYSIPGKVLDFYADLNVMTVEGCGQPASLIDATQDGAQLHLPSAYDEYNKQLLEADEQLQVYDLSEPQVFKSARFRRPISNEFGCKNLVDLDEHSIESLVWNLKLRFKQDSIYTYCGNKILLSVNPNRQLNNLYNLDQAQQYDTLNLIALQTVLRDTNVNSISNLVRWLLIESGPTKISDQNEDLHTQRPHLFALANEALKRLIIGAQDQCFVLLGDSGSGKTEACKLLVQYLATVNKAPSNVITEQILESIQVLESFGNAKTIENNNSSRFGKMLDLRFNLATTLISDAQTFDLNLLDRTRIVSQCEQERNYHIFYELLAGLSSGEKEKYGLQKAEKYFYLNQGHCVELPGKEDAADFRALLASMQVLGFNCEELDTIFRILASILHLGNIYFHRKLLSFQSSVGSNSTQTDANGTSVEGVEIGSDTELRWVSHLLQIQFDSVLRCLTVRTIETGPTSNVPADNHKLQRIVTPLNIDQALDARDAIARALYTCLFKWLVQRINAAISKQQTSRVVDDNVSEEVYDQSYAQNRTLPDDNDDANEAPGEDSSSYLCRTSESLCEFQPDKLSAGDRHSLRRHYGSSSVSRRGKSTNSKRSSTSRSATMSILDAFGFEKLGENNFEQLCINYAAELLNYHTHRYLIRLEQDEYAREQLLWTPIELVSMSSSMATDTSEYASTGSSCGASGTRSSATALINLIAKKPLGILALLDDECNFPKATDQSFAEKCHHNHALNENYQCARLAANCQEFGIKHFKQNNRLVWYRVDGFIEKNRDNLRPDIMDLLLGSKMPIVGDMLRKLGGTPSTRAQASGSQSIYTTGAGSCTSSNYNSLKTNKTLSRTHDGRYVSMKPRTGTIAARFLDALHHNRTIEALSCATSGAAPHQSGGALPQTEIPLYAQPTGAQTVTYAPGDCAEPTRSIYASASVWFVVCLKPNRSRAAHVFDVAYVQEQVRATHLLELACMRRFGFPVRMRYGEFVRRYKCLVPQRYLNEMTSFCQSAKKSSSASSRNKQRRSDDNNNTDTGSSSELRKAIRKVCSSIVEFRFNQMQSPKPIMQQVRAQYQCGLTKVFLNEKLYHQLERWRLFEHQRAIQVIQKTVRMWLVRSDYLLKREAAIVIQAQVRSWLAQRSYWRQYSLLVMLQRRWRYLAHEKRIKRIEAQRRAQRAQQRKQLEEIQSRQHKLANQNRFRSLAAPVAASVSSSAGGGGGYGYASAQQQLDIPEDLAHLYRLLRSWAPVHTLANISAIDLDALVARELKRRRKHRADEFSVPFLVVGNEVTTCKNNTNDLEALKLKVESTIERLESHRAAKYSLEKFLLKYYSIEVPQFGYSRLPILRPFSYRQLLRRRQRELCQLDECSRDAALIEQHFETIVEKSLAMYKLLLRYIDCDQPSRQVNGPTMFEDDENCEQTSARLMKFKLLADYIIDLCLSEPHLRDEIYLQLASLMWQNPRQKSVENCWRLFLDALHCFDPNDKTLASYLLIYANNYCCDQYRAQVCKLLVDALVVMTKRSNKRGPRATRSYPPSLLEFWANQTGVCRFAMRANCLLDLETPTPVASEMSDGSEATNYSNRTMLEVESARVRADEFAARLVRARQVPESNLFGWSVEVLHESALIEFSNRLRGDDCLMDHFGQIELLPELAQLIDDERLRRQSMDSHQLQSSGDDCVECTGSVPPQTPMSHQRANLRRRSRCRASVVASECNLECCGGYERPYPSGCEMSARSLAHSRRSMSMQELQLEAARSHYRSPTSGRSMRPVEFSQHYASSCVSSGRPAPSRTSSLQRTSGGSRHLDLRDRSAHRSRGLHHSQHHRHQRRSATPQDGAPRYSSGITNHLDPMDAGVDGHQPRRRRSMSSSAKPKLVAARADRPDTSATASGANAKQSSSVHYASSALSDTSEAASMASHVRHVKVPHADTDNNADLDRYLDDLFNPMLAEADLDELSDAKSLAASIRGTTESTLKTDGSAGDANIRALSPTFESLLKSLRTGGATDNAPVDPIEVPQSSTNSNLDGLNLSQLRALNEHLENEIQAAQSASRRSLEQVTTGFSGFSEPPPPPPPQPSFGPPAPPRPKSGDLNADDIYNRTKTIRVGKWRWPPAPEKLASGADSSEVGTEAAEASDQTASEQVDGVGRLKLSSEMKAKLEQLTGATGDSGTVSDVPDKPKRLADQRRNLLEHQLLGNAAAGKQPEADAERRQQRMSGQSYASSTAEQRLSSGSKVLAVKQQLAAAAGVALEALAGSGGSGNNSRRQSAAGAPNVQTQSAAHSSGHALAREELGPQSSAAIGQRQAFYGVEKVLEDEQKVTDATGASAKAGDLVRSSARAKASATELVSSAAAIAGSAHTSELWVASSPDPTLVRASKSAAGTTKASDFAAKKKRSTKGVAGSGGLVNQSVKAKTKKGAAGKKHTEKVPRGQCLVYSNVDWQIRVRKEVFMPSETYDNPLVVQLIFAQLVYDVFNPRQQCTRLNNKERAAIKSIMKENSIGYAPQLPKIGQMQSVKLDLVRLARSFGLYFARTYPARNELLVGFTGRRSIELRLSADCTSDESTGCSSTDDDDDDGESNELCSSDESDYSESLVRNLRASKSLGVARIDLVGVHHSGLRLVATDPIAQASTGTSALPLQPRQSYKVIETLKFRDMDKVSALNGNGKRTSNTLLVQMRNGRKSWLIGSTQAAQLHAILKTFHEDYCKHFKTHKQPAANGAPVASGHTQAENKVNVQQVQQENQSSRPRNQSHTAKHKQNSINNNSGAIANNQNAVLARDNDYDGANIEKRQASDSFERLRSKTSSNNDLVDSERALHDNLADSRAQIDDIVAADDRFDSGDRLVVDECSGAARSRTTKVVSDYDTGRSRRLDSARDFRSAANAPSGSGSGLSRRLVCNSSDDDEHRNSTSTKQLDSGELSATGSSEVTSAQEATSASDGNSKKQAKRSMWQSSLSKMSTRFSLLSHGSSNSKAAEMVGQLQQQNWNGRKEELRNSQVAGGSTGEAVQQQQRTTENANDPSVLLDAWVETKVDFDDEDDDEDETVGSDRHASEQANDRPVSGLEQKPPNRTESNRSSSTTCSSSARSKSHRNTEKETIGSTDGSATGASTLKDDGKYSMLQFALHNFQEALEKYPLRATTDASFLAKSTTDTSTLRGSLKLIERLRGGSTSGAANATSSPSMHYSANSQAGHSDWTWKELAEMVKFTKVPLRRSLIRLRQPGTSDLELERRACECFVAIMQFMGDLSKSTKLPSGLMMCNSEVECVYLILINLHNFPVLRDEIYCQLIKQTTNNRSDQSDSCLRGWRLFSIVAAYFDCSPEFKPYLLKYLEAAAYDKRRAYCQVASICVQNLRKTFKYGGRKNVPSIEEIAATSAGRNSKRQIYRLPGGTERVINTKSTTVVDDIIHEICSQMLNVTDSDEMREFSLYCIADFDDGDESQDPNAITETHYGRGASGDQHQQQQQQQHCATMPLNGDEYILDITTELIKSHRQYFLIFCRSIWHYPLRLDNKLYIEVIFNQIAPDYLEGLLLVSGASSSPSSTSHGSGMNRKTRSSSSSSMSSASTGTPQSSCPLRLRSKVVREIAKLAALLQRATSSEREPRQDELRYLLPKPIVASMRRNSNATIDLLDEDHYTTESPGKSKHNWLELVHKYWLETSAFDSLDAKAQFLDIVRHWHLFGSSFFAIKLIQRDLIQPIDYILALNKLGVQMLDHRTHETVHRYAFNEVVSTRKVRSEDGALFLDLKCGSLIKRTIVRIQTDQAHEINRLIKQYIEIDLRRNQCNHQQVATAGVNAQQ